MTRGVPRRFDATILREYDMRGIVGQTLAPADARALGRAFGTRVARNGGTSVAVGRDGRLSSPEMEAAVVDGLSSAGLKVFRIGVGPTPMLYYAVHHLGAGGGLMVTGSHNPPDYNGFKMMLGTGPFFGADITDLGRIAAAGDFVTGQGSSETVDLAGAYVDRLLRDYDGERPLTVVWDCGNGVAGPSTEALTARLPGRHTVLFPEVDATFPDHHPAPTEPNKNGNPRLSAEFSQWLMGWPAGWVTDPAIGISRNDQLRIVGNDVCSQQAIAALRYLLAVTA